MNQEAAPVAVAVPVVSQHITFLLDLRAGIRTAEKLEPTL